MQEQSLPLPGLEVTDPAAFARVWGRVMPDQSLSPVVLDAPAPIPTPQAVVPVPAPDPATLLPPMMDGLRNLCVQYLRLTRRCPVRSRSVLATLAEGHKKSLRRMGAVYFLLTGSQYCPHDPLATPIDSLSTALRDCFLQERHWLSHCQRLAEEGADPCLAQLSNELSSTAADHLLHLRTLAEQLCVTP